MAYIETMTAKTAMFPVKKFLTFSEEQWARVRAWRFAQRIDTEAETVRRLIDRGLSTSPPVRSDTPDKAGRS